jgi:hypothetical protein
VAQVWRLFTLTQLRDGFHILRSKRLILGNRTRRLILRLQAAAAAVFLLAAAAVQAVF